MADTIWQDLVDLNQHFRVLVLRTLNGVRPVVFEREVAIAETWKLENKRLVTTSIWHSLFLFQYSVVHCEWEIRVP